MGGAKLLAVAVGLGLLLGCGGGGEDEESAAEKQIKKNLLRVAAAWRNEDAGPFYTYYSEEYDFDEVGKDDHLASIFEDFPYIREWRLTKYSVDMVSSNLALAKMHFTMSLYADVSALDQAEPPRPLLPLPLHRSLQARRRSR